MIAMRVITVMPKRYSFGRNWKRFLERNLNEERIQIAKTQLLESLRLATLEGMTFLDIGCGSGLHSLAAFEAGAKEILSLDFDQDSVEATQFLWSRSGCPANWAIQRGDVLDRTQIEDLGKWDVVYSWGVLHHTGRVWDAFQNASVALADDGVLLVALYNSDVHADPEAVLALKQRYNRSTPLGQRVIESGYIWKNLILPNLKRCRPWVPLTTIINYRRQRGMSYYTDVRDWLGGWPMEFTGIAETREFAQKRLGLKLLACYGGAANTSYLFCRKESTNYWGQLDWATEPTDLVPPFTPAGNFAYSVPLPTGIFDSAGHPTAEDLKALHLTEDGRTLGPNAASFEQIQRFGSGAFTIVENHLVFAASNNSDPNQNGRIYTLSRRPRSGGM